jgi:hypothetical protein
MNYKLYHSTEIISSTPLDHDHSVGFHDVRPFNKSNNNLVLLHRYPLMNLGFKKNNHDKIDICIWDFNKSKIEKIDETDTWSWEQGSRLQWINEKEIIYNQSINQNPSSAIYNILNNNKKTLNTCIYSINKNGSILSINYSRIWKLWKSYGYNNLTSLNIDIDKKKPDDDGIFLCDLNNNKQLILSIKKAVNLCGLDNINKDFFLCHPTFNPSGNKFMSLLRFFNDSGALISYLICTDLEQESSFILAREKVSHFEWIDDNEIVVWCRNLNQKIVNLRNNSFLEKKIFPKIRKILNFSNLNIRNKILSNAYHVININNPSQLIKLNNKSLNEDGHPQISPDNKFLITDTYANKDGYMKLLLLDRINNKVYTLGEFKLAEYLYKNSLKYDLHPRWDNSGNLISFDSSHEGSRQSYIINIKSLLSRINSN